MLVELEAKRKTQGLLVTLIDAQIENAVICGSQGLVPSVHFLSKEAIEMFGALDVYNDVMRVF